MPIFVGFLSGLAVTLRRIFNLRGGFSNPEREIPHDAAATARSNFLFPACTSVGATAA